MTVLQTCHASGHVGGLQTLVKADPRCVFVHCQAHNLNLAAQDSIDSQVQFKNEIT
jgi:hypothetical protein